MNSDEQVLLETNKNKLREFSKEIEILNSEITNQHHPIDYYQKMAEITHHEAVLENFMLYHRAGKQETKTLESGTTIKLTKPIKVIEYTINRLKEIRANEEIGSDSEYSEEVIQRLDKMIEEAREGTKQSEQVDVSLDHIKLSIEINNLIADWYIDYYHCKSGTLQVEQFIDEITPNIMYQIAFLDYNILSFKDKDIKVWQWNRMSIPELEYEIKRLQRSSHKYPERRLANQRDIDILIEIVESKEAKKAA